MTRTSDGRPLPVLISHVLGPLTAELEGTDQKGPGLAMWSNVLRCVATGGADGIDERSLPEAARISSRLAAAFVTAAANGGWITAQSGGKGKNRHLQLTDAGQEAAEVWPHRLAALDAKWQGAPLRSALERLVGQLRFELPHFPASYGAADPSAIGGPYVQKATRKDDLPAHGKDWKPVMRSDEDSVSSVPITALLSQALVAFTIDYEDRFPWPLANTATILCHIGKQPRPLADLPAGHGITGQGKSLLERHLIVNVTPDPDDSPKKLVSLSDRGELVLANHPKRLEAVEQEWSERYGELVAELRAELDRASEAMDGDYPDHVIAPLY
jgi:hypothetical protein